jgi:succinate-semialdehyde dehydrogenase/glutarate-semialdehyde dehydrogenase
MPWNFPFWQVVRFAAPALAAGNVGLLKHAANVPQCALALEDLFHRSGAPPGVFQVLLIPSSRVEGVIGDGRVAAVTLTGSDAAGRAVAGTAGRSLKKTVLELGGSDPFIVTPSADLDQAVATAVKARIQNNGQSCIAAKRFILLDGIADDFERQFVDAMRALRVGDPMDPATDVGPLATSAIRDELHDQVAESVSRGARLLVGGQKLDGAGWFYEPTVLSDIPRGSPAFDQELFGPVASLFRVSSLDEAISLANDTPFGLGASAWTSDPVEAERFASGREAGSVFINGMVASDPRFPFGGVKQSGYGRELGSWGLQEFVNIKTVRRF